MTNIFIDGEHGTTGLQIHSRLANRKDIEILSLPFQERHNKNLRRELIVESDIVILCLPDEAACAIVDEIYQLRNIRVIDSSTAHRTDKNWIYGFAEMQVGQARKISNAQYVANPGCYATGAISLLRPLTENQLLDERYPLAIFAVSGYTGGGKQMIAQMEDKTHSNAIDAQFFSYSLHRNHKHIPEIMKYSKVSKVPAFLPNVAKFKQGMIVNIPIPLDALRVNLATIRDTFARHYEDQTHVYLADEEETNGKVRLNAEELAGCDDLKIYLFANEEARIINLCALFDNLGKGAAGAAVQNLNLMLG